MKMKTYEDIYIMMCNATHEYSQLHCTNVLSCHFCKNYSYCGIDSINIAKLMIFEY